MYIYVINDFVHLKGDVLHPYVPTLTMAVINIIAAIAAWVLPETRGKDLPETLEDARRLVR